MPSVLDTTALTTLSNLKEYLNVASTDTSKDNTLERVINRTSLWVEDATHRKLKARLYNGASGTHTTTGVTSEDYLYLSGSTRDQGGDACIDERGCGIFYLPAYPVRPNAETNSLTFKLGVLTQRDSTGETWDDTQLTEFVDYVVDREGGAVRLLAGWFASGYRNYRVTMAAGLLTGSAQPYVPADLEGLCLELCKQVYRDTRNLQSESIGTWSRSYNRHVVADPYTSDLLAKFTRPIL